MATTTRGYPYPAGTDAPAGPTQLQNLAQAIDTDVTNSFLPKTSAIVLTRSSTASVPTSTPLQITSWGGGTSFNPSGTSLSYSSGLITVGITGLYVWSATVGWPSASSGRQFATVWQNGSVPATQPGQNSNDLSTNNVSSYGGPLPMTAGDTLQLVLYQNSGLTMTPTPQQFSLYRVA